MESLKKVLKELNMEEIRARANSLSSTLTNQHQSTNSIQKSYECEICKDQQGHFYRDEQGYEFWKDCVCIEKKKQQRLIASSQITEEFQKKTFKNFEHEGSHPQVKEAYDKAYTYTINFPKIRKDRQNSICLLGQPGSGKTHLLMAIANNLIKRGIEVIYFPWTEGFNELKGDFDKLEERINRLQKVDVLYIDDMFKGRDKPTEFQKEQAFAIINYRYLQNLPVLISSERSIAQMCEVDEALGSRINEMCRNYKATLNGGIEMNYRLRE